MFHSISRRMILAFAAFTLGLSAWFSLLVMASAYTVEDSFFNRALQAEAEAAKVVQARTGSWPAPSRAWVSVHEAATSLPRALLRERQKEPEPTEFAGDAGKHYHVLPLREGQAFPLLVADVSEQLVVRPVRNELLAWLAGWTLATCVAALLLAAWLARRLSRPLQNLAAQVARIDPQHLDTALPSLADAMRSDEVGVLSRTVQALVARVQSFAQREQRFTRDASHELRTPLAVMRLTLEPSATSANQTLSAKDASSLYNNVLLMQDAVEMLLMLARDEPAASAQEPRTAVLPLVQQWVLAHEAWLAQRRIRVDCHLPEREGLVWPMPRAAAQTVLSNLLNNAVQHGSEASTISLNAQDGQLRIANTTAEAKDAAPLPGLGWGLSIVDRLLQRFGGSSQLSKGDGLAQVQVSFAST